MMMGTLGACGSSKSDSSTADGSSFVITLYPDEAPITCENFEKLVKDGFYDGLKFHRVVDGFMAQGGDPSGDGTGGSSETIKGEFSQNGVENNLSHTRGVVSMARSNDPDSASSQFFICYSDDDTFLDGQYAAFGKVTSGMDIVDQISNLEVETRDTDSKDTTKKANKPINPPVITSITVETYGVDYGKPKTVEPFDYYSYMMRQHYRSSSSSSTN